FAVGFSVSQSSPNGKDSWIDALLIKALASPSYLDSIEPAAKTGFVQGLSISPETLGSDAQKAYDENIQKLLTSIFDKDHTGVTRDDLSVLREVPLFKRCP